MAGRSAEFGSPAWTFGQSHYAFLHDGRIVCLYFENGSGKLALIDRDSRFQPIEIPWTAFQSFLTADSDGRTVWIVGASPTCGYTLLEVDPSRRRAKEIRSSIRFPFDARYVSSPESLWFAAGGDEVHAYLYPAHNPAFQPPRAEKPPLLVNVHGGPTGQAFPDLKPEYQYWTSRGFSILDVNYGGSTGFGRAYRQRLAGQWGIVDVRDCVHGARAMVGVGRADGRRLAIRGSSAGGYTTLRALTLTEDFRAGASRYGVADLERLARETHKFESHYLDGLVGPYPESAKIYRERSPLHHADRLTRPVILFQGLEDEVVPPSQSEAMVAALGARRVPHAYLAFPGESHGFRSATVRARCLEAELYFYLRVFGIEAAEPLEPVAIADL